MYTMCPVSRTPPKDIDLPKTMYIMPFLFDAFTGQTVDLDEIAATVTANMANNRVESDDERVLHQLLDRQEVLIRNLNVLEREVKEIVAGTECEMVISNLAAIEEPLISKRSFAEVMATPPKLEVTPETNLATDDSKMPTVATSAKDFCIHVDVGSQPLQVRKLIDNLHQVHKKSVFTQVLYHSSALEEGPWGTWSIDEPYNLTSADLHSRMQYDITITFIVKKLGPGKHFLASDLTGQGQHIVGDAKIAKHLAKVLSI